MKTELYPIQVQLMDNIRATVRAWDGQGELITQGRRFRQVEGFPRYLISDHGDVFSRIRAMRFLAATIGSHGYSYVSLMADGSSKGAKICLHILVARAFVPNPHDLPCVNHKNGISRPMSSENLEWMTYSENNIHAMDTGLNWNVGDTHYAAKINENVVRQVRALVSSGLMHHEVAEQFGLKRKHVTKIVNRQIWARVA